jgi:hypothetical protein
MVQVFRNQRKMPARIVRRKRVRSQPDPALSSPDWTGPTLIGYAAVGWPRGLARRGRTGLG